jgi:hypothetical protein
LCPEARKKSSTALSSKDGEFATSTTTCAPRSAVDSPSPVMVLTPEFGDAATTSWPSPLRRFTTFEPMRPVPPITTTFMRPAYVPDPPVDWRSGYRPQCRLWTHLDSVAARAGSEPGDACNLPR